MQVKEQDAANRTTQIVLGNGLTQSRTFNVNTDWLETATLAAVTGPPRLQEGYEYDAIGNVSMRAQYWDQGGFTETFEYDELNRLRNSKVGTQQQDFTYDDAGNIKSWTGGVGTGGTSYVYPAQGSTAVRPHGVQQIDGGMYLYDLNGNMSSAPRRTYTWTSFDMPLVMTKETMTNETVSAAFVYGPEHQRTRQTRSDGSVEVYGGAQVTERKGDVLTVKTYWPLGVGVEIDVDDASTKLNWVHSDRLGSPVGISDDAGVLQEKLAYDAWGKRRATDGTIQTPDKLDGLVDNRGFTSHEMLDQLDLVHMNGRVYDPAIGRFVSADPILQDPMNGQSYNRYSYVLNNPTNLTDPTGFQSVKCGEPGQPACPLPPEKKKNLECAKIKGKVCASENGNVGIGDGKGGLIIVHTGTGQGRAGLNSAGVEASRGKSSANNTTGSEQQNGAGDSSSPDCVSDIQCVKVSGRRITDPTEQRGRSLADQWNYPNYNSSDPRFHRYGYARKLCSTNETGCTVGNVIAGFRCNAGPGQNGCAGPGQVNTWRLLAGIIFRNE